MTDSCAARHPTQAALTAAHQQRAELIARLRQGGQRVVGAKLSLTTAAAQTRTGATGQIFGWLTDAMRLDDGGVHTNWTPGRSRGEGEVALVLGSSLRGPGLGALDALNATKALCAALDLPSSAKPYTSHVVTTMIANNANAGHFAIGGFVDPGRFADAVLTATVQSGTSTQAVTVDVRTLAKSVADFANELAEVDGTSLPADAVILTGGLTGSFELQADSTIGVTVGDLATVRLRIGAPPVGGAV